MEKDSIETSIDTDEKDVIATDDLRSPTENAEESATAVDEGDGATTKLVEDNAESTPVPSENEPSTSNVEPTEAECAANDAKTVIEPSDADVSDTTDENNVTVETATSNEETENTIASEEAAEPQNTEKKLSRRQRKRLERRNWHERALEHDIKYRGPLSYRHLRILAWVSIILWQIGLLVKVGCHFDAAFQEQYHVWGEVLPIFKEVMMPLFLFAAFATILNNSRKYSSLLVVYGGFSVLVYLLFVLVYKRYLVGLTASFFEIDRATAETTARGLFQSITPGFSFNIFIDLFLCTLLTCFLLYHPRRFFVGKRLILFRLLAILPIAYEATSVAFKMMSSWGSITLSPYVYPLLTTKPPMTFVLFAVLAFFIKYHERIFCRRGHTHEEYLAFVKTNKNSLHVSTTACFAIVITVVVDLILMLILGAIMTAHLDNSAATDGQDGLFATAIDTVSNWGFGQSLPLLLVIPVILLFSYTRSYRDTRMDLILPIVGIFGLAIVYSEGLYQMLLYFGDMIKGFFALMG